MQKLLRGCRGCCSLQSCKGGCDCGVKVLKLVGGFLTVGMLKYCLESSCRSAAAIAYGFAIYLQNVKLDRYHYPYVCSWVFAIIQAFAVTCTLS